MSESSGSSFKISSDSDSLDLASTFEDASEALFTGSVTQVTNEDAVGASVTLNSRSSFSLTIRSLFSRSSSFNNKSSSSEFTIVLGNSLLKTLIVGESNEGNTLGSATSSFKEIDVFNATTVREMLGDFFSSGSERKTLDESLELRAFSLGGGVNLFFFPVGHAYFGSETVERFK
jgi:hypothetical protein